jgi:hypothetical protein
LPVDTTGRVRFSWSYISPVLAPASNLEKRNANGTPSPKIVQMDDDGFVQVKFRGQRNACHNAGGDRKANVPAQSTSNKRWGTQSGRKSNSNHTTSGGRSGFKPNGGGRSGGNQRGPNANLRRPGQGANGGARNNSSNNRGVYSNATRPRDVARAAGSSYAPRAGTPRQSTVPTTPTQPRTTTAVDSVVCGRNGQTPRSGPVRLRHLCERFVSGCLESWACLERLAPLCYFSAWCVCCNSTRALVSGLRADTMRSTHRASISCAVIILELAWQAQPQHGCPESDY